VEGGERKIGVDGKGESKGGGEGSRKRADDGGVDWGKESGSLISGEGGGWGRGEGVTGWGGVG